MAETPDRYCGNCGHELSPEDQFCRNCGTPVHQAARVPTPEADVPVPPPPQAGAGGGDALAAQAPPQESVRRGLSNPYNLGCLGVVGFILFAIAVAAIIGGIRNGGGDNGGEVADKPKQERQAAQQEQPKKKDPQPQQEEQQAQGGQKEQKGGEQKPEPQEPEPQEPNFASFGDGTYQVGTDLQPGTYRTREGSPNCYYERLKNFTGGLNSILANNNTNAPATVTIRPTDAGFNSQGCGTWTKALSAITTSTTSFNAGTYIVGTDFEPGTYRSSGGNNCYYERLRDFTGGMNSIIANGNTNNPTIVTIAPTDAGFQSHNCGTWTQLE